MIRPMCALLALAAAGTAMAQGPAAWRVEVVAGSSLNGDGGPATLAQMGAIQGLAVDRAGNLYLSDTDHHRVRKVNARGDISTVAGTGTAGFSGDGGAAAAAQINLPYGLAADGGGNLYIADLGNKRIRRVAPDGTISTYAGGGAATGADEGGLAQDAVLRTPRNVAVDAAGNLYLSEFDGQRVRKVTPDGRIVTVAGTGAAGFRGDGGPASAAQLAYPAGLALDRAGSLYIADSQNQRVRQIAPGGTISTVAGGAAALANPTGLAVDSAGTLYISDGGGPIRRCAAGVCSIIAKTQTAGDVALQPDGSLNVTDGTQIRRIDVYGQVTTVAGDAYLHAIGDGGPATAAMLLRPSAIALDGAGSLYIADTGTNRVRRVGPAGDIRTVAGTGLAANGANDLDSPAGVAANGAGEVWIADTGNDVVRKLSGGAVTAVVGMGTGGSLPLAHAISGPGGLCLGPDGSLFVADTGNHRVLRLPAGGAVETVAGDGTAGIWGDGGPARLAQLNRPSACSIDSTGALLIADTGNQRIRKVTADGAISTVAAGLSAPRGVAADASGNLLIADSGNDRICLSAAGGKCQTIVGPGDVRNPGGLLVDRAGALYVADTGNDRVLRLTAPSLAVVNAATLAPGPVSPGEVVAIFGSAMGPDVGIAGQFDTNGMLPTQLGGVEVRFDGTAAPLFYAQSGQINAQVPYSVAGGNTHMQIFLGGRQVATADVAAASAAPALFPVAISQDHPAPRGSAAVFYATGEGLTTGANIAGLIAAAPYAKPVLPVTLTIAGVAAQLLYVGSAPGTAGILQINAVIPGGFVATGPAVVRLSVGGASSPPLTIWLN